MENKISEASSITDQVESDLDNIEKEQLPAVAEGIAKIESIKSDLDQAKTNLAETEQLESQGQYFLKADSFYIARKSRPISGFINQF